MQKTICAISFTTVLLLTTGCAQKHYVESVPKIDPAKLPVVLQGQGEYKPYGKSILFIPAGTKVPVKVSIKGDIFTQDLNQTLHIKLKNNTYVYANFVDERYRKYPVWISHDKIHWKKYKDVYTGTYSVGASIGNDGAYIHMYLIATEK